MKRPASILKTLVTALAAVSIQAADAKLAPTLGRVSLGDTREVVRQKLGQPSTTENLGDHLDLRWRYDGLDVYFYGDPPILVGQIVATKPRHCTSSGVCPGSSLSQMLGRLGPPRETSASMDGTNTYLVDSEACWLEVTVASSMVSTLAIKCQP
jgi:hypothetical protein